MIFFILFILENCTFGFANYITFYKLRRESYRPQHGLYNSRRGLYSSRRGLWNVTIYDYLYI